MVPFALTFLSCADLPSDIIKSAVYHPLAETWELQKMETKGFSTSSKPITAQIAAPHCSGEHIWVNQKRYGITIFVQNFNLMVRINWYVDHPLRSTLRRVIYTFSSIGIAVITWPIYTTSVQIAIVHSTSTTHFEFKLNFKQSHVT